MVNFDANEALSSQTYVIGSLRLMLSYIVSLGGMLVILPISLVNQSYLRSVPQALFAIGLLVCYLVAPLLEKFLVDYVGIDVSEEYLKWRDASQNVVLLYVFYISGVLSLLSAIRAFGSMMVPKRLARRFAILRLLFMPNDILRATNTKRSGTYKLNAVIERAYQLHTKAHKRTKARNADHETMLSFLLYGDKYANTGGLLWSWKNFAYLNKQEGVWLQARLAVGQVGQIMVSIILTIVWWFGTKYAAQSCESTRDDIKEVGGLGAEWGLYFVPEAWM